MTPFLLRSPWPELALGAALFGRGQLLRPTNSQPQEHTHTHASSIMHCAHGDRRSGCAHKAVLRSWSLVPVPVPAEMREMIEMR